MADIRPLSDLTESLQSLAKSKHDDSIMTGSAFVDAYGVSGQPLDTEVNRDIATAGGDLQTAYSKLYSVYMKAKNANDTSRNEFKLSDEAEQSLNTKAIVGDLTYALESLYSAAAKLDSHDVPLASDVRDIATHVEAHRERIKNTGIVVLR